MRHQANRFELLEITKVKLIGPKFVSVSVWASSGSTGFLLQAKKMQSAELETLCVYVCVCIVTDWTPSKLFLCAWRPLKSWDRRLFVTLIGRVSVSLKFIQLHVFLTYLGAGHNRVMQE